MLIESIETLKELIPTIVGNDIARYRPYLETADAWLSREITGPPLFGKLTNAGNSDLLKLSQSVVAYKAYFDAIPFLDLIETETGFGVVNNDKIVPASKERVQALLKQTEQRLSDSCESLIRYLEDHSDYHTDWKASAAFSLISDCYIYSLDEFKRYAPFTGTRLDFVKAKPILLKNQKLKIESVISPELSSQIISQLRGSGISEDNGKIIELLRFALAFFTIDDSQYKAIFNTNPYELKAAESLDKYNIGDSFLVKAYNHIISNTSKYPAFESSDIYAQLQENFNRTASSDEPFLTCGV
jgi:hypothetical protein